MLLLFLRTSGILIGSPVFGRKFVPNLEKIGFCAILSFVFLGSLKEPAQYTSYDNLAQYVFICISELAFGAAMGFVLTTMFDLTLTAGGIMDYQIGFTMAGMYDTTAAAQSSLTGSLINFMLLLSFFMTNGHLKLIEILYNSINLIPIGSAHVSTAVLSVAIEVVSKSFVLAIIVSLHVIAAGIMMEIALGVVVRTVPQLNMFVVGIPIKIILGLSVMMLSMTVFYNFTTVIFDNSFTYIGQMFDSMRS